MRMAKLNGWNRTRMEAVQNSRMQVDHLEIRDNELSWPYIFFLPLRNGDDISTLRLFRLFEESGSDFQGFHLLLQNRQLSFFFS
jgi:hypothetical protein